MKDLTATANKLYAECVNHKNPEAALETLIRSEASSGKMGLSYSEIVAVNARVLVLLGLKEKTWALISTASGAIGEKMEPETPPQKKPCSATKFMLWATNECVPFANTREWFMELYGEVLGLHFYGKWSGGTHRHYNTSTEKFLLWFWFEMSDSNKDILLEWIEENYKG